MLNAQPEALTACLKKILMLIRSRTASRLAGWS